MNTLTTTDLDLATALAATLVAAAPAKAYLPILESVQVKRYADGLARFTATDRYRAHQATIAGRWQGDDDAELLLNAADVKPFIADLKRWAKEWRNSPLLVVLSWEDGAGTVRASAPMLGRVAVLRTVQDGSYPKVDALMPPTVPESGKAFFVNPAYLSDATGVKDLRIKPKDAPLISVHPSETDERALVVKQGGWFRALVMPCRARTSAPTDDLSTAPDVEPMQDTEHVREVAKHVA